MKRTVVKRRRPDLYERELGPAPPARWWLEGWVNQDGGSFLHVTAETEPWWVHAPPTDPPNPRWPNSIGLDRDGGTARWIEYLHERRPTRARRAKRSKRGAQLSLW